MHTQFQSMADLGDKAYRAAFVRSQINVGIPFQVRSLREKRGWSQKQLAKSAGMLQPRISAIERPGGSKLNLETLLRLASGLDVGLIVRFAPFSEMMRWANAFSPDAFAVPSFDQDQQEQIEREAVASSVSSSYDINVGNALDTVWQFNAVGPVFETVAVDNKELLSNWVTVGSSSIVEPSDAVFFDNFYQNQRWTMTTNRNPIKIPISLRTKNFKQDVAA